MKHISYKIISAKKFIDSFSYGSDSVIEFVNTKYETLTDDDIFMLLTKFDVLSDTHSGFLDIGSFEKMLDKVVDKKELIKLAYHNHFKASNKILEYVLKNDIYLCDDNDDKFAILLKELVDNSLKERDTTGIKLVINKIKNPNYIFDSIIETEKNTEEIIKSIGTIVKEMKKIDDKSAVLIAPYLLNKKVAEMYRNGVAIYNYAVFINRVDNLNSIELYVISTKNKEIIAYYIYKAERYDLILDLFKNDDIYISFCKEVFSERIVEDIKKFMRETGRYKFIDKNIEDYLSNSNEKIDIKIYGG